jgi:predicted nucleic acid-binding Zn ribbon protein
MQDGKTNEVRIYHWTDKKMAGLIAFIKGSSDPKDNMPGCANYGECLFADTCLVEQGKRCRYFERAVLPTISGLHGGDKILNEYQNRCRVSGVLKIKMAPVRFCQCGQPILPGRRFCDKCKQQKRKATYRESQRQHRVVSMSTVKQK